MVNITEIKILMFRKNLTAYEVAEKLGLSRQTFYNKMNGKAGFTIAEADKLIQVLGIDDPNKIFFGIS